jgi:hypothetical protein
MQLAQVPTHTPKWMDGKPGEAVSVSLKHQAYPATFENHFSILPGEA